MIMQSSDFVGL